MNINKRKMNCNIWFVKTRNLWDTHEPNFTDVPQGTYLDDTKHSCQEITTCELNEGRRVVKPSLPSPKFGSRQTQVSCTVKSMGPREGYPDSTVIGQLHRLQRVWDRDEKQVRGARGMLTPQRDPEKGLCIIGPVVGVEWFLDIYTWKVLDVGKGRVYRTDLPSPLPYPESYVTRSGVF